MPRAWQARRRPLPPKRENRDSSSARGYGRWFQQWGTRLLRSIIAETGNPFCRYCERNPATLPDHVIPPSSKGAPGTPEYDRWLRDPSNIAPCCLTCNSIKGNRPATHPAVMALRPIGPNGARLPLPASIMAAHIRGQTAG